MREEKKHQSWKINILVRARNLNFKFKIRTILSSWKLNNFSIQIKLPKHFLKVKAEGNRISIFQNPRKSFKSRFIRFPSFFSTLFRKKTKISRPNNLLDSLQKNRNLQEAVCLGSVLLGALVILLQSVPEKYMIQKLIGLICIVALMNLYRNGKSKALLMVAMVAALVCAVLFGFDKQFKYLPKIARSLKCLMDYGLEQTIKHIL